MEKIEAAGDEATDGNISNNNISNINNNIVESRGNIKVEALDLKEHKIPSEIAKTEVSLLLAADIIYDDTLTYSIIQTVHSLIIQQYYRKELIQTLTPRNILTCLFSIEKRINFTIRNLNVAAPAYDYFIECLNELDKNLAKLSMKLNISYVTLDDKSQWFCYQRCKDLVIVRIDVHVLNN